MSLGAITNSGTISFTNATGTVALASLSGNGITSFAGWREPADAGRRHDQRHRGNGDHCFDQQAGLGVFNGPATITNLLTGTATFNGPSTTLTNMTGGMTFNGPSANITTLSRGSANFNGANPTIATLGNATINIGAGVALAVASGSASAGTIAGPGALIKTGTDTLILVEADSHTGGTTITSGAIQIGNNSTAGSITGDITDNGALAFSIWHWTTSLIRRQNISGTGSLTQFGPGVLTLTGVNTYSTTSLLGGTLAVSAIYNFGLGAITIVGGTLETTASITSSRNFTLTGTLSPIEVDSGFTYNAAGRRHVRRDGRTSPDQLRHSGPFRAAYPPPTQVRRRSSAAARSSHRTSVQAASRLILAR